MFPILFGAIGIDVLIATTGYGVALSAALASSSDTQSLWLRGLQELVYGALGNLLVDKKGAGFIAWVAHLLDNFGAQEPIATHITFVCSTALLVVQKEYGFPGAATSSSILGWAIISNMNNKEYVNAAKKRLKKAWVLAEPCLFSLIGASILFS